MNELNTFIRTARDSRELKRALAVKNTLAGRPWKKVAEELGVCESFLGKWRQIYARQGVNGLKLGHKGSSGYLTPEAKADVKQFLQKPEHRNMLSLRAYIAHHCGVEYKSLQSYYTLLHEAGQSWKKSQKRNPRADPEKVMKVRGNIKKKRRGKRSEF